ncbi:Ribokinase-like protein [Stipitochalara longipes BDJ]|nr:Ribokinase-like protein [Stipitochalara longipes BDJ]
MAKASVLVIGSLDKSNKTGLHADQKVLEKYNVVAATATTGSTTQDSTSCLEIHEAPLEFLRNEIDEGVKGGVNVFKIGTLYTEESVLLVADALKKSHHASVVVDTEAIFKTGRPTPPSVLRSVREKLLPLTTVLSATVPEVKLLLDDAGVLVEYPKSIEDIKHLAKAVQALGAEYVLVKREIFDEKARKTTLHYLLCGPGEPVIAASTFENVKGVVGLSYSIPAAITANFVDGEDVPAAVSAAFKFAEDEVLSGVFFE